MITNGLVMSWWPGGANELWSSMKVHADYVTCYDELSVTIRLQLRQLPVLVHTTIVKCLSYSCFRLGPHLLSPAPSHLHPFTQEFWECFCFSAGWAGNSFHVWAAAHSRGATTSHGLIVVHCYQHEHIWWYYYSWYVHTMLVPINVLFPVVQVILPPWWFQRWTSIPKGAYGAKMTACFLSSEWIQQLDMSTAVITSISVLGTWSSWLVLGSTAKVADCPAWL